jgi:DNA-binding NarL/FixJ family response regulator
MVVASVAFMNRLLSFQSGVMGVEVGAVVEPLIEPLTDREIQVLGLLAQGLANKQIATTLTISEHTVKFHVSSIYAKLGAASRTEAVRLGVLQGLITL